MNKETIVNTLIANQYSEKQANQVAEELLLIDDKLTSLLEEWVSNTNEPDIIVEGFSLIELKDKYKMTYPAALLTIDWLIKEPNIAVDAINRGIK